MERQDDEVEREIINDLYLSERATSEAERQAQATAAERGPVLTFLIDAKDLFLGGLNGAREHPVGTLEVGTGLAVAGVAAGITYFRLRAA